MIGKWLAGGLGLAGWTACAVAAPAGINFYGSRVANGNVTAAEPGFDVAAGNWGNVLLSHTGNPSGVQSGASPATVMIDGVPIGVSVSYGSLFHDTTGAVAATDGAEARILNHYIQNSTTGSANPGFSVTLTGLSALPDGSYHITLIGSNRDITFNDTDPAFQPLTVSADGTDHQLAYGPLNGYTLNPARASARIAISASSPKLTADSITISSPAGSTTGDGLAAILIGPPRLPRPLNVFAADTEIPQWNEGDPQPDNAWESRPTANNSAILPLAASLSFDPGKDASADPTDPGASNPNSGSLKVTANFGSAGTFHEWRALRHFPGGYDYDLTGFEKLAYEVFYDPASTMRGTGFGYYDIWLLLAPETEGGEEEWLKLTENTVDGVNTGGEVRGPTATKWVRTESVLPTGNPRLKAVRGLAISGVHRAGGNATLWIDNLQFVSPGAVAPVIDPALALEAAPAGLLLTADVPLVGDAQNLRTVPGDYTWIGRATPETPVSYSFTIGAYPALKEFESHIYLVPEASDENGTLAWTANPQSTHPHAMRLTIRGQENGSAWAHLAYKLNSPNGDGGYWAGTDSGHGAALGTLSPATTTGTWTLRFTGDSAVTLTGPGNTTASWTIPAQPEGQTTVAQAFGGQSMAVYFGIAIHDGQAAPHLGLNSQAYLTQAAISGVPQPRTLDFTTAPDPAVWTLDSSVNPAAVAVVTSADRPLWVRWNSAVAGTHFLTEAEDLAGWAPSAVVPRSVSGGVVRVLKTTSHRPAGRNFYRLEPNP